MPGRKSVFAFVLGPIAAALALGVAPAAAQFYPGPGAYMPAPPPPPMLRARDADAVVRSLGLHPVGPPQRRGPVFVVHAVGQEGSPVMVTLNRHTGRVLQILRTGYGSPRIAAVPPPGAPPYVAGDDEEFAALDEEAGPPAGYPGQQGPSVITRRGIEAHELPAPGVTGSVPGGADRAPRRADPLLGVPREFRGGAPSAAPAPQPRVAARPPEPAPRSTPVPRPRPADAPAVVQKQQEESAPAAAENAEEKNPVTHELSPAAKEDIKKFPPAQGFE